MLAIPLKPSVDESELSTASSTAELKAINDEAFGETKNGLRMAVISRLQNAPWDSPHKLSLVVENVSGNIQTISVSGSVPECDVRRTSKAQLQTLLAGRSGHEHEGRHSLTLDPGARAIVARLRVRVTSDFSVKTVPDDADLLIFDANVDRLRNVVYVVKCTQKLTLNAEEFSLTTGPFAIAFNRPTDRRANAPRKLERHRHGRRRL